MVQIWFHNPYDWRQRNLRTPPCGKSVNIGREKGACLLSFIFLSSLSSFYQLLSVYRSIRQDLFTLPIGKTRLFPAPQSSCGFATQGPSNQSQRASHNLLQGLMWCKFGHVTNTSEWRGTIPSKSTVWVDEKRTSRDSRRPYHVLCLSLFGLSNLPHIGPFPLQR